MKLRAVRGLAKLLAPLAALAGTTALAVVLASRSGISLCGGHLASLTVGWGFEATQQLCPIVLVLIALCAGCAAWAAAVVGVDPNLAALPRRVGGRRLGSLAWVVAAVTVTAALAAGAAIVLSGSLDAVVSAAVLTAAVFTSALAATLLANAVASLPLAVGRRLAAIVVRIIAPAAPAGARRAAPTRASAASFADVCALALCQGLRAPPRSVR